MIDCWCCSLSSTAVPVCGLDLKKDIIPDWGGDNGVVFSSCFLVFSASAGLFAARLFMVRFSFFLLSSFPSSKPTCVLLNMSQRTIFFRTGYMTSAWISWLTEFVDVVWGYCVGIFSKDCSFKKWSQSVFWLSPQYSRFVLTFSMLFIDLKRRLFNLFWWTGQFDVFAGWYLEYVFNVLLITLERPMTLSS